MGMSDVEVAVHAAALAAGVAASHLRESLEIEYKGAYSDPVTDADREAEQAVRDFLAQERPADGVIGEELVDKPGKRQWLVDPIDGTVNYLRGNAYWCSAVALVDAGRAVASAVHATDGPTSFTAEHHRGAWRNGNPLDLDTAGRLDEAVPTWAPSFALRGRVVAGLDIGGQRVEVQGAAPLVSPGEYVI